MTERAKITASHHSRQAIVYLRQSSPAQVEHNREFDQQQYALATKARELGWPDDRIVVIDEDLGLSGSGSVARSGFARLTAEVALARVGLVLGAPRPKAEARLGERSVPVRLQHLHYRLLHEAVDHRRDAQRPHAAHASDFDAPHRAAVWRRFELVWIEGQRSFKEGSCFDGRPVTRELPCCAPLAPTLSSDFMLDDCFHPRSCNRRVFNAGLRCVLRFLGECSGFALAPAPEVQLDLIILPLGAHEIGVYWRPPSVRASAACCRPTTPSADFCAAVRSLRQPQSHCRDAAQISRGKTDRLRRTPAGSTTPTFDGRDFAIM